MSIIQAWIQTWIQRGGPFGEPIAIDILCAILLGLIGTLAWRVSAFFRPGRLLRKGDVYNGLRLLAKQSRWPALMRYLATRLPLPDANLRAPLLETVEKMVTLRQVALGPKTAIPEPLRAHIVAETGIALEALWHACQRLAVVGRLRVDTDHIQAELAAERAGLEQLANATHEAQVELARLNLSAGRPGVADVIQRFGRIGWAAAELRRLDIEALDHEAHAYETHAYETLPTSEQATEQTTEGPTSPLRVA